MKKILLAFFIAFAFILSSAHVLADANLDVVMSATALSGLPGSSAAGSFVINNTNATTSLTSLVCSVTGLPSGWSASCSPTSTTAAGSTQTVGLTVAIPAMTNPGQYSGLTINASGSAGAVGASDTQLFSVTVGNYAALTISWLSSPSNIYQEQLKSTSMTYNITNVGNVILNVNGTASLSAFGLSTYNAPVSQLLVGGSVTGTISVNASGSTDLGLKTVTFNAYGVSPSNSSLTASTSSSQSLNVYYPYCDNVSNMSSTPILLSDIKNQDDVDGEDFKPLDSVDLTVKVKNTDIDDSHYAVVEMVVMQGNSEVSHTSVKSKSRISKNDYYTFYLNMTLPADIEEGAAYLYVKVYNDDHEENCQQRMLTLNIEKNSRDLQPYNLDFPTSLSCGGTYTFSGDLINVGDSDEDKVQLSFTPFSLTSGNTQYDETSNLYSGNKHSFSFDVAVPTNMTEGSNRMTLKIEYDYDEDNDEYTYDDSFNYPVTLTGCKKDAVTVTTESSTALVSTQSEVKFLVSNPSSYAQTYTVSATADWATVGSVTPQTFTLNAGAQQYVTVQLTPNKDATIGVQTVNAKVAYGSTTKTVSIPVSVQKSSSSMGVFDQITYQFKYNTLWAVLDVVLVVAIVALLVMIFVGKRK